jgi:hypothetical protein
MPILRLFSFTLLALFAFSTASRADIIATVDNETFAQNSGVQTVNVVFRSTNTTDTLFSFSTDFSLEAGIFDTTPGTFGNPGDYGEGNIDEASEFLRDPEDLQSAVLTLEFNSAETMPIADATIARLAIDTTGVGPGTYAINIFNPFTQDGDGVDIPSTAVGGSFTISAVPEPTSLAVLSIGCIGSVLTRRRHRRVS